MYLFRHSDFRNNSRKNQKTMEFIGNTSCDKAKVKSKNLWRSQISVEEVGATSKTIFETTSVHDRKPRRLPNVPSLVNLAHENWKLLLFPFPISFVWWYAILGKRFAHIELRSLLWVFCLVMETKCYSEERKLLLVINLLTCCKLEKRPLRYLLISGMLLLSIDVWNY